MKITLKKFIVLQGIFLLYSISSVFSKLASGRLSAENPFPFLILFGISLLLLGVYAILWQQVIKNTELSIAYANKALTLFWSLLWGVFLFGETITLPKILGIVLVAAGIILLNGKGEKA